jgi:hypothetical protein
MRIKELNMPTTWLIFWQRTSCQMLTPVMKKASRIASWPLTKALSLMSGIGTQIYSAMIAPQLMDAKLRMMLIHREQDKMVDILKVMELLYNKVLML